jgi:hypothetical protein
MARADHTKVSLIKGRDGRDAEPFGDCDHGGVRRAERKVGVRFDQIGHPPPVARGKRDDVEQSGLKGPQEGRLDLAAAIPMEQVADLGRYRAGHASSWRSRRSLAKRSTHAAW